MGRLWLQYRADLTHQFAPHPATAEKTRQLLADYLTRPGPGQHRLVIGVFLEAEDFEYLKKFNKKQRIVLL